MKHARRIIQQKHLLAKRLFSSDAPPTNCDIVKGPSLLRTTAHRPRPSLLFLPGLRSLPFWTQCEADQPTAVAYNDPQITQAVKHLEENVETIRQEYLKVASKLPSDYQTDTEHTLHQGTWDWHSYMTKGTVQGQFAQYFPETTSILQELRKSQQLFEGTPFGYTFFSTLHSHSKIDAHAAPMNLRLRVHLPLIVPAAAAATECGIRVGPLTRPWCTDKALVLDDAYEHEVWNDTAEQRVLLLVDLWHPDVTMQERQDIVELFQHAQKQGWWSNK